MTFDDFIKKYEGKGIDVDGYPTNNPFQCIDLYRQYCKEVLNIPQSPPVRGACDIWDSYLKEYFDKVVNTPEGLPLKGDIVIWGCDYGGGYGHVAIFWGGTLSKFTSFDQNSPQGSLCKLTDHSYNKVLGWLHPKGEDMPEELDVCLKDREKFWKERDEARKQVENLKSEMEKLKEDAKREISSAKDEAQKQKEALSELVAYLANQLGTTQDVPKIKAEASRLIEIEDQLTKCRKENDNTQKLLQNLQFEVDNFINEAGEATKRPLGTLGAVLGALQSLYQVTNYKKLSDFTWFERFISLFYLRK